MIRKWLHVFSRNRESIGVHSIRTKVDVKMRPRKGSNSCASLLFEWSAIEMSELEENGSRRDVIAATNVYRTSDCSTLTVVFFHSRYRTFIFIMNVSAVSPNLPPVWVNLWGILMEDHSYGEFSHELLTFLLGHHQSSVMVGEEHPANQKRMCAKWKSVKNVPST